MTEKCRVSEDAWLLSAHDKAVGRLAEAVLERVVHNPLVENLWADATNYRELEELAGKSRLPIGILRAATGIVLNRMLQEEQDLALIDMLNDYDIEGASDFIATNPYALN